MKRNLFLLCAIALVLSACTMPVAAPSTSMPINDQAATIVAATLAAIQSQPTEMAPLASPTIEEIPTYGQPVFPSATAGGPAPTIQPQATPTGGTGTPTATTLTVDLNTYCREGPGMQYKVVLTLVPGTTYQIVARSADSKYWVVTPIGSSNTCWVPLEFSNNFGNTSLLPVITPSAPTALPAVPVVAPTIKKWNLYCYGANLADISIEWNDKSSSEDGYRILRNNVVVVELPANSNYFFETINLLSGQSAGYVVQAFNAAGVANSSTLSMTCP